MSAAERHARRAKAAEVRARRARTLLALAHDRRVAAGMAWDRGEMAEVDRLIWARKGAGIVAR